MGDEMEEESGAANQSTSLVSESSSDSTDEVKGAKATRGGKGWKSTPEDRAAVIEEFEKSGEEPEAFCKRVGISTSSLKRWSNPDGTKHKGKKSKQKPSTKHFSPDQRRQAVEEYLKSGLTLEQFGKVWATSSHSLAKWVKHYRENGPKSLLGGFYAQPGKKRGRKKLATSVVEQIIATKRAFPEFGLRKIRAFLVRFKGVRVSTGTIRKKLSDAKVPTAVPAKHRRRRKTRINGSLRFERSKPMQMWQSDITQLRLNRPGEQIYLVVFMDDHSRYVVSWRLALRQTAEFVIDAFLEGVHRFGKPVEVLTDQGRQYHTWRGRSEFRKILDREGIKHVTSRPHHPQTLGKCERFWETVGTELWDRVQPRDLDDARERLAHFIAHYNHMRPHQGIEGMVPADRFFGVEGEMRKVIEKTIAENELKIALGEEPRVPLYVVGQVDGSTFSLRGEAGKVVVQTPGGAVQEFNTEHFGQITPAPERQGENHDKTSVDAVSEDGNGNTESIGSKGGADAGGSNSNSADIASGAAGCGSPEGGASQEAISEAATGNAKDSSSAGQSALGAGKPGREGAGPQDGGSADGVLDGSGEQNGNSSEAIDAARESVAALKPGALGYDGGTAQTTQGTKKGDDHEEPTGGSEGAA